MAFGIDTVFSVNAKCPMCEHEWVAQIGAIYEAYLCPCCKVWLDIDKVIFKIKEFEQKHEDKH